MYTSALLLGGLCAATLTLAHPVIESRNAPPADPNALPPVLSKHNQDVLDLALYLEYLEQALYTGGYTNFNESQYRAEGFPAGFRDNVKVIADHETTHAATISAVLSKSHLPTFPPCSYQFPYSSPTTFVDLANMITSVGIGAYLGGGALLTNDPALLTAASSILTVEARHDSYLRAGVGGSPFPTAFDTSLPAIFAYNLAQPFIKSCPPESVLPIPILPTLKLVSPAPDPKLKPVAVGTALTFQYDAAKVAVPANEKLYIALINKVTNVTYIEAQNLGGGSVQIASAPKGAGGAAFAVLTCETGLTEDQLAKGGVIAGPAEVILS